MLAEKNNSVSVIYLHGRPSAHPIHQALARAVTNEFAHIDEPVRWQDKNRSPIYNLLACLINAFLFKKKNNYDVYLIDNLHFTPVFLKIFRLVKKNQKIVVHLGSHTLYFMFSGKFSKFNTKFHKWILSKYDAVICEGNFSRELADNIVNTSKQIKYTTFIGISESRRLQLSNIHPDLTCNNIIIIAGGPSDFRKFYKGLDLMVSAFNEAKKLLPELTLTVIGNWDVQTQKDCTNGFDVNITNSIKFVGAQKNIERFFSETSLCLHCSRGDAFPTSTIETMAAGIPTMVSTITGTKEIAVQVHQNFVVDPSVSAIIKNLLWYFSLSKFERTHLSNQSRLATKKYTEENSISAYKETFAKICKDFNITGNIQNE